MIWRADEAIKQIRDKKYDTELRAEGISDVQMYGIAFSKSKATVKVELA